jgi:hypothetical protein
MGFKVEPSQIVNFARELSVVERSARSAATHAGYTNPTASGGAIFQRLMVSANNVEGSVSGMFKHLEKILGQSVDELRLTAKDYRNQDYSSAAKADSVRGKL